MNKVYDAMSMPQPGDSIAVWFSCGAASAVAAKRTIEKYGETCTVRIVNNPVAEEDADNLRFLQDVEVWLGCEIETATNPAYPSCSAVDVWNKRAFMSGPKGAPCTIELKKRARAAWEVNNPVDWHVLGFTVDEKHRAERIMQAELPELMPVLIDDGMTKEDCFAVIREAGIDLPMVYQMGYPNANCIGCVKATSPTYWNLVREKHPEVFEERAKQSREIGAKLVRVRNERIFLDELDPSDIGRPLKSMQVDCGIFCEPEQLDIGFDGH